MFNVAFVSLRFYYQLRDVNVETSEDGTVLKVTDAEGEPEMEIPFNLENLRKHLAQLQFARRVLPEDVTARQTLLEASVHDVAFERFKHEDALFKQLGLGISLQERNLQAWMWSWHQALVERLEEVVKDIVNVEKDKRTPTRRASLICLVKLVIVVDRFLCRHSECSSSRAVSITCES
jgi:DNA-directed RNA polymerase, mitochondrial